MEALLLCYRTLKLGDNSAAPPFPRPSTTRQHAHNMMHSARPSVFLSKTTKADMMHGAFSPPSPMANYCQARTTHIQTLNKEEFPLLRWSTTKRMKSTRDTCYTALVFLTSDRRTYAGKNHTQQICPTPGYPHDRLMNNELIILHFALLGGLSNSSFDFSLPLLILLRVGQND